MTVGRTKAQGARHEELVQNHSYVATSLSTMQPTPITRLPQSERPICSQRTSHAVTPHKSLPYANHQDTHRANHRCRGGQHRCFACKAALQTSRGSIGGGCSSVLALLQWCLTPLQRCFGTTSAVFNTIPSSWGSIGGGSSGAKHHSSGVWHHFRRAWNRSSSV